MRANLVTQFNQLKDQLDKTAQDASFNGVNLLNGDVLKLFFNELSTSTLSIQSTNPAGINSSTLGIPPATNTEFQSNTQLDARLQTLPVRPEHGGRAKHRTSARTCRSCRIARTSPTT